MRGINIQKLLILSLLIQISAVFFSLQFPQHPDLLRHLDWAKIAYFKNLEAPYEQENINVGDRPYNLPPGSLYTLESTYRLDLIFTRGWLDILHQPEGSVPWINLGKMDFIFFHLPQILANLLTGYLIYKIAKRFAKDKSALIASSLYLFNPAIIYNSAFWGQIDPVIILSLVTALYFLIKGRVFPSLIFTSVSIFFKFTALPLIPFFGYFYFLAKGLPKAIFYALVSFFALLVLTLPVTNDPIRWVVSFLSKN
jgi:hypothetical protein